VRNPSFAPAAADLGTPLLGPREVARSPAPEKGLALDETGLILPTQLAPNPVDAYLLGYDNATKKSKWVAPSSVVAPTHLPGMGSSAIQFVVTANTAYLMPIGNLVVPTTITRISWSLTVLVAGNYDVGVYYSDDESTFTLLNSKGSTVQPAVGNIISTISSTTLTPVAARRWYYAIAMSTGSTVGGVGTAAGQGTGIPGYTKATSFPLPTSLTGMAAVGAIPLPVLNGAV
jgi:hypothetical protein